MTLLGLGACVVGCEPKEDELGRILGSLTSYTHSPTSDEILLASGGIGVPKLSSAELSLAQDVGFRGQLLAAGVPDKEVLKVVTTATRLAKIKTDYDAGTSGAHEYRIAGSDKEKVLELAKLLIPVTVESQPGNAILLVDGERSRDNTSTTVWLLEGKHVARVALKGYKVAKQEFEVKPGKNPPVTVKLEPLQVGP